MINLVMTGLVEILVSPSFRTLPESPRWLYSRGKTKQAEEVLLDLAQRNGNGRPILKLRRTPGLDRPDGTSHGVLQLITHPVLRWRTVVLMYVW